MKNIVLFLFIIFVVFELFILQALRRSYHQCASQYEPDIVTVVQLTQAVFSDKFRSCEESYETLMSWELCRQQSQRFIPIRPRPFIVPLVNDISLFLRDQEKDIEIYKHDHDERCKGYTYLMFYPPESE